MSPPGKVQPHELSQDVLAIFNCPICKDTCKNPVIVEPAGAGVQIYCNECITRWWGTSKRDPNTRGQLPANLDGTLKCTPFRRIQESVLSTVHHYVQLASQQHEHKEEDTVSLPKTLLACGLSKQLLVDPVLFDNGKNFSSAELDKQNEDFTCPTTFVPLKKASGRKNVLLDQILRESKVDPKHSDHLLVKVSLLKNPQTLFFAKPIVLADGNTVEEEDKQISENIRYPNTVIQEVIKFVNDSRVLKELDEKKAMPPARPVQVAVQPLEIAAAGQVAPANNNQESPAAENNAVQPLEIAAAPQIDLVIDHLPQPPAAENNVGVQNNVRIVSPNNPCTGKKIFIYVLAGTGGGYSGYFHN